MDGLKRLLEDRERMDREYIEELEKIHARSQKRLKCVVEEQIKQRRYLEQKKKELEDRNSDLIRREQMVDGKKKDIDDSDIFNVSGEEKTTEQMVDGKNKEIEKMVQEVEKYKVVKGAGGEGGVQEVSP